MRPVEMRGLLQCARSTCFSYGPTTSIHIYILYAHIGAIVWPACDCWIYVFEVEKIVFRCVQPTDCRIQILYCRYEWRTSRTREYLHRMVQRLGNPTTDLYKKILCETIICEHVSHAKNMYGVDAVSWCRKTVNEEIKIQRIQNAPSCFIVRSCVARVSGDQD